MPAGLFDEIAQWRKDTDFPGDAQGDFPRFPLRNQPLSTRPWQDGDALHAAVVLRGPGLDVRVVLEEIVNEPALVAVHRVELHGLTGSADFVREAADRPGRSATRRATVMVRDRRQSQLPARRRAGHGRGESAPPRSTGLLAARAARFVNMLVAACLNVESAASEVSSATGQQAEHRRAPSRSEGKPSEPGPCPARRLARAEAGVRMNRAPVNSVCRGCRTDPCAKAGLRR